MPDIVRGGALSSAARSLSAMAVPRRAPRPRPLGPSDRGVSSMMEFHSPQASQRPDQRLCVAPQAVQVKEDGLAMA
jgi:hypothetical protein